MIDFFFFEHFRGIKSLTLSLTQKNHIIGPNGSGKTHILDMLHILTGARPLYGVYEKTSGTRAEVSFWRDGMNKRYQIAFEDGKERFWVQGERLSRPKYLQSLPFRTVYISPFDMNILYFAPEMRRNYMDDILARVFEGFTRQKRSYELTVRQRNTLLKRIREWEAREEELHFWDQKIAQLAHVYGQYRERYLQYISHRIPAYPEFFWSYDVRLQYQGDWFHQPDREEYIRSYLYTNRARDIMTGHTHIGPHRDDIMLMMPHIWGEQLWEEQSVQFYLSRGEMKMLLLGLKLIEADMVQEYTQKSVILLVDDIFAELDEENILRFLKKTIQHQMILTSQKPLPEGVNPQSFSCINISLL